MILIRDGLKWEEAYAGLLHEIHVFISLSSALMAGWSSVVLMISDPEV